LLSARATRLAATVLVALIATGPAGCGADESQSGGGAQPSGQGRQGFAQDPKVAACLKKEGVELPQRPAGASPGSRPRQGTPPAGGERPQGRPPGGGGGFGGNSEQAQKVREALKKCGVELPQRPARDAPPEQ
jgi:hypothetical protein